MAISDERWKATDKKYINWYHCLRPCVTFIAVSCFISSVSLKLWLIQHVSSLHIQLSHTELECMLIGMRLSSTHEIVQTAHYGEIWSYYETPDVTVRDIKQSHIHLTTKQSLRSLVSRVTRAVSTGLTWWATFIHDTDGWRLGRPACWSHSHQLRVNLVTSLATAAAAAAALAADVSHDRAHRAAAARRHVQHASFAQRITTK